MTSGTYPWSFVVQIFHNGQSSHGGDRKTDVVMPSTLLIRTLGSVASVLSATLYQGNLLVTTSSGTSDQLRDIYSICRRCWNVATYKWNVDNEKIEIISMDSDPYVSTRLCILSLVT